MSAHFAVLAAIGYNVTIADRQVIFEGSSPIHSTHARFAFERPRGINDSPGIWYLTHLDTSSERIPMSHLIAAHEWCVKNLGASFEPYRGELAKEAKP